MHLRNLTREFPTGSNHIKKRGLQKKSQPLKDILCHWAKAMKPLPTGRQAFGSYSSSFLLRPSRRSISS
jgi:hypothetical protein